MSLNINAMSKLSGGLDVAAGNDGLSYSPFVRNYWVSCVTWLI